MVYITGDTHGDFTRLGNKNFPENKTLKKSDYLIILGDFGGVWEGSREDRYWLDWLDNRNFTTLFVDGNHENFDLLETYPVVNFKGGKVNRIRESVFRLKRGEIYTIDNKKYFVMGGANSIDKANRVLGKSWWKEEIPNKEELKNARFNLMKHKNKVDYILTHRADRKTDEKFSNFISFEEIEEIGFYNFLDSLDYTIEYDKWFFGHYHRNVKVTNKKICLYNNIIKIGGTENE